MYPKVSKEGRTSYLQVEIKLSQKEHKGVVFLLGLQVSFNSYIPLFIFSSTPTADKILLCLKVIWLSLLCILTLLQY